MAHSDGLIVVDASAVLEFFTGAAPDEKLRRRILTTHPVAPELLDVEVAHVLRRMAARGHIPDVDAEEALHDITEAPIARAPRTVRSFLASGSCATPSLRTMPRTSHLPKR